MLTQDRPLWPTGGSQELDLKMPTACALEVEKVAFLRAQSMYLFFLEPCWSVAVCLAWRSLELLSKWPLAPIVAFLFVVVTGFGFHIFLVVVA